MAYLLVSKSESWFRLSSSDRTGLEAIWSSRWSTPFSGFGSIDLIGGVAWIKAGGAPGAPQLIPLREED